MLYKRSIVDSLSDLIFNLNKPSAHPLIASKRELLGYIQSLHLELSHKADQPTYSDIMRDRTCWKTISQSWGQDIYKLFRLEADQILSALTLLSTPPSPSLQARIPAFPKLERLSICSIYGPQSRRYDDAKDGKYIDTQPLETTCQLMTDVFSLSPLVNVCSRGRPGPLSLRSILDWSQVPMLAPRPCTFVFHFRVDEEYIPAAVGAKSRWILEQHQRINPNTAMEIVKMTGEAIIAAIDQRNSPDFDASTIPDRSLQLEIYSSSKIETRTMRVRGRSEESFVAYIDEDGELERAKIGAVNEAFHKQELEGNGGWPEKEGDIVEWFAGIDAPPCEACGGEFDHYPLGRWGEMSGANMSGSFTEHNGVRVD